MNAVQVLFYCWGWWHASNAATDADFDDYDNDNANDDDDDQQLNELYKTNNKLAASCYCYWSSCGWTGVCTMYMRSNRARERE